MQSDLFEFSESMVSIKNCEDPWKTIVLEHPESIKTWITPKILDAFRHNAKDAKSRDEA